MIYLKNKKRSKKSMTMKKRRRGNRDKSSCKMKTFKCWFV
jgi:hypothetical protein